MIWMAVWVAEVGQEEAPCWGSGPRVWETMRAGVFVMVSPMIANILPRVATAVWPHALTALLKANLVKSIFARVTLRKTVFRRSAITVRALTRAFPNLRARIAAHLTVTAMKMAFARWAWASASRSRDLAVTAFLPLESPRLWIFHVRPSAAKAPLVCLGANPILIAWRARCAN